MSIARAIMRELNAACFRGVELDAEFVDAVSINAIWLSAWTDARDRGAFTFEAQRVALEAAAAVNL